MNTIYKVASTLLLSVAVVGTQAVYAGSEFFNYGSDLKKLADSSTRAELKHGAYVEEGSYDRGAFTGYIFGVIGMLEGTGLFCIKDGVKMSRIEAIVKKEIDANPEKWEEPASNFVVKAMENAFPCKK